MERFKDIPGYEGLYQVSTEGRVRNSDGRILRESYDTYGYVKYRLYKDKKAKTHKAHKLVAMAFLGHIPNGYNEVVDHINNIKTDNNINNLQLTTARINVTKDMKMGTSKYLGVCWAKRCSKWKSAIWVDGKSKHLGYFDNEEDASAAYQHALQTKVH